MHYNIWIMFDISKSKQETKGIHVPSYNDTYYRQLVG